MPAKADDASVRRRRAALLTFAVFWLITCVKAPAGLYLVAQHTPTVLAFAAAWWLVTRRRMDGLSLGCWLLFWTAHCIGARWIYSYVPYDEALRALFGQDTGDWFGWRRNHYDRLVHFLYGVCATPPMVVLHRRWGRRSASAAVLAVEFVLASSALYELAEWGAAVVMAPDWADSYLGQQGDIWDAQKGMALAGAGSAFVAAVSVLTPRLFTLDGPKVSAGP